MLYIVATPIGNLQDITLRAIETLKEVDFVLCEDTRVTRRLLEHYGLDKKMISYHQHTDDKKMAELVALVKNNKVALVTDAGTPGINDPGGMLIRALKQEYGELGEDMKVVPIPGPCAAITALSVSGFPTDEFLFKGFVPHKKGRQTFLKAVLAEKITVVFYESCHRIIKCLEELNKFSEELKAEKEFVVGRELTKKFETVYRGKIAEVLEKVKADPVKGEYAVVVH